jgi:hypothetical protein
MNAVFARRFIPTATASALSSVTAEIFNASKFVELDLDGPPWKGRGKMTNLGWTPLIKKKNDKPKHGSHFSPPKCIDCDISMRIKRRQAHPMLGPAYELQTYACARCGQIRQRDAATPGAA